MPRLRSTPLIPVIRLANGPADAPRHTPVAKDRRTVSTPQGWNAALFTPAAQLPVRPGDLLFYQSHNLEGQLVSLGERLEGAPVNDAVVTHVAIVAEAATDPNNAMVVEAIPPVIRRGRHRGGLLVSMSGRYPVWRVQNAIRWLNQRRGRGYGWADIAANVAEILHLPVETFTPECMDCSHLAYTVLTLCGEDWAAHARLDEAATWVAAPQLVTPAALYAYCVRVTTQGSLPLSRCKARIKTR